ncbi:MULTISPECIES: DedA family protein [Streptomyces]|uniref:Putative Alkaline phosphatase-like protein n=1 Tax=Streptomyces alboflavus TaxID=67267 RepID=A0A1Z1W624_9ACTN|nr:DedA family protein [Streptomyces alboflavus]ARX81857.1 putative Alkaline phosphatase-like protein [Streptomyces alboflavus]
MILTASHTLGAAYESAAAAASATVSSATAGTVSSPTVSSAASGPARSVRSAIYAAAPADTPAGGIAGWAADLMDSLGAIGAGVAIALENLFPPLPSEVILPLAGFAASQGKFSLLAALLWTTVGSVVGALALYWVGALLGRDRTVAIAARLPLVKTADIEKTEAWFERHGTKAVFFGRMIPIFRSMISIPAGIERMPLPLFLGLTTLGSLLWNSVFVLLGYGLGSRWHEVTDAVGLYSKGVLGVVALAVIAFVVVRIRKAGRGAHRARG